MPELNCDYKRINKDGKKSRLMAPPVLASVRWRVRSWV